MAPQRKNAEEKEKDNGSSSTKDKALAAVSNGVTKSKKAAGSNLKDVINAATAPTENGNTTANHSNQNSETLDFNTLPRHSLHSYRSMYNLHQPASFRSLHNGVILSVPGSVGLQSPTMLRAKEKRRIPKRALAKAVRNHFMDQSVNELDVEARMMYNVKSIDKAFRMKFTPNSAKK